MFDLNGKTALVTGASGGIGAAIARALHSAGATVALSGTRKDALEALAGELNGRTHMSPLQSFAKGRDREARAGRGGGDGRTGHSRQQRRHHARHVVHAP